MTRNTHGPTRDFRPTTVNPLATARSPLQSLLQSRPIHAELFTTKPEFYGQLNNVKQSPSVD